MQALKGEPPVVIVTSSSSTSGWPIQRPHSSASLTSESPTGDEPYPSSALGVAQAHHHGSLGSIEQSIASQSTVRLANPDLQQDRNLRLSWCLYCDFDIY